MKTISETDMSKKVFTSDIPAEQTGSLAEDCQAELNKDCEERQRRPLQCLLNEGSYNGFVNNIRCF
jgi:hypothetical protein